MAQAGKVDRPDVLSGFPRYQHQRSAAWPPWALLCARAIGTGAVSQIQAVYGRDRAGVHGNDRQPASEEASASCTDPPVAIGDGDRLPQRRTGPQLLPCQWSSGYISRDRLWPLVGIADSDHSGRGLP